MGYSPGNMVKMMGSNNYYVILHRTFRDRDRKYTQYQLRMWTLLKMGSNPPVYHTVYENYLEKVQ